MSTGVHQSPCGPLLNGFDSTGVNGRPDESTAGLTQRELAEAIGAPCQRINEIVNGRRGITPSTALRLFRYFGTSSGFWMNGQTRWDLYHTQQTEGDEVRRIRRHPRAISQHEASA